MAVDTLEVAVGEEDITDPGLPRDRRFFSPVETDRGDIEIASGPAVTIFPRTSPDPAVPRAESADLIIVVGSSWHIEHSAFGATFFATKTQRHKENISRCNNNVFYSFLRFS